MRSSGRLSIVLTLSLGACASDALNPSDWSAILKQYEANRYAIMPSPNGYRATGPGQGSGAYFDGAGATWKGDDWTLRLQLQSFGRTGAAKRVPRDARMSVFGNRLAYRWTDSLEEWFVNRPEGTEHGFTLTRPPSGTGKLRFSIGVSGGLQAVGQGRSLQMQRGDATVLNYTGLKVTDAAGRTLPAVMNGRGSVIEISVDDTRAVYPITVDPLVQQATLKPANLVVQDAFGASLAASGDTVVVGAPGRTSKTGSAYVFVRNGTSWTQQAVLKAANAEPNDMFGASVAISGDTVIVGAYGEDSGSTGINNDDRNNDEDMAGAAYVFVRSGATWSQQAYIKASEIETEFGRYVAISGDTAVVSASGQGLVYVFTRTVATWSQQAYLSGFRDSGAPQIALSGNTIVVGMPHHNSDGKSGNGIVRAYVRNGSAWTQQAEFYPVAPDSATSQLFGTTVAVSGDTAIIGTFESTAYVYQRSGSAWTKQAKLTPNGPTPLPQYAETAVGISGDIAVVSYEGTFNTYTRSAGVWTMAGSTTSPNAASVGRFGISTAISGTTMVTGADRESPGGAAYVYVLTPGAASIPTIISTSPAGLSVTVDGTSYTAPQTFSWTPLSTHTVAVNSPQAATNTRYVFGNWSDGGAQAHSITVNAAATITANFAVQHKLSTAINPLGAGSVTTNPTSIDGYYYSSLSVKLTATPTGNYRFLNWTGDISGSTNPQSAVMSVPRSATANFVLSSPVMVPNDINADARTDTLLYDPAGPAYAALSNGTGGFSYVYTPFSANLDVLRLADTNADGKSDLVLYNSSTALGYLGTGAGNGTFNFASLFWGPGFNKVVSADLNADGRADFILHRTTDGTTYTAISNGSGGFTYKYTLVSVSFTDVLTADFNGDGRGDVLFFRAPDGLSFLGISDGAGGFAFSPVTIDPAYDRIDTGDITGDGKADIVFYYSGNGAAKLGVSTGTNFTFTPQSWSPNFSAVKLADTNADGKADLLLYNKTNTLGYLGIGAGNGTFTFGSVFWGGGMEPVVVGDLNADGRQDFIIYNTTNGASYTCLSTGNAASPFTFKYDYWGNGKVIAK